MFRFFSFVILKYIYNNIESAYTMMHEKYLKNLPLENIEIK